MKWEEISRRLRNGTSVSVLAELAGTTYKNMYNRIRRREQLDGKQYLKADQLKRPYMAQGGRKKAARVPEVVKDFAGIPEGVVKDTLEKYKKEQADAVREMHAIETMYKLQKAKEMKLRTVVLALERLLEGGGL